MEKKVPVEHSVHDRIKELNCLYNVTRAIMDQEKSIEKIFHTVVGCLPPAWQYPDITCARIVFGDQEYISAGFKKSKWKQSANIFNERETVGAVEVYYLKKTPFFDEGPFLKEERLLINAIAERISNAIKRIRTEEELRIERIALENKNIALKEVIERIQVEKDEIAKSVQANVDKIIIPIFSIFEQNADFKDTKLLKLLKKNLEEVTSPFTNTILNKFTVLSPVEIQICDYIKNGFSTKDIAQFRGIAIATVSRHREHIRKKLNLTNKNINLVTYLNDFMSGKPL